MSGCPHCESRATCECPTSREVCPTGACECPATCPCRDSAADGPRPWGCLLGAWPFLRSFWWWPIPIGFVLIGIGFADGDAGVDVTWPFIVMLALFLLLLLIMGSGLGRLLRAAGPETEPAPPPLGCGPVLAWFALQILAALLLVVALVWLLGDADDEAAKWVLLPAGIALIVAGLGLWLWHGGSPSPPRPSMLVPLAALVMGFLAILLLVAWFVFGRVDLPGPVLVDSGGGSEQREPSTTDEADPTTTDEATDPITTDEATDPITTDEVAVTPLSADVIALLSQLCIDASGWTEEDFYAPIERQSGPGDRTGLPAATDAPGAVRLDHAAAVGSECDTDRVAVIATTGGDPTQVQLSLALTLSGEGPGHVSDPAAPGYLGFLAGWHRFYAYSSADGLFEGDAEFDPQDSTAQVVVEGDAAMFIVDRPAAQQWDWTFQTFYRHGTTATDPISWQAGTGSYAAG